MKIKPLNKKIKIEMIEEKIGNIQSESVQEKGKIIDMAEDCYRFELYGFKTKKEMIGKTIYFKSWAVDVITIDDEKHYFLSEDSDAICGISD